MSQTIALDEYNDDNCLIAAQTKRVRLIYPQVHTPQRNGNIAHLNGDGGSTSGEESGSSGGRGRLVVHRRNLTSKSNSERGKAFRAKKKKYEVELHQLVTFLQKEVIDLNFLRDVRKESALHTRNSMTGSLVRLAREYFAMFKCGSPSALHSGHKRLYLADENDVTVKQEAFLHHAMDLEVSIGGGLIGIAALMDQWKRYTTYHASFRIDVTNIEASGTEDEPIVTVWSEMRVRYSRDTFNNIFPHVAHNEDLMARFIGKEVIYKGKNQFHYSEKGQINGYDSDVGFIEALVEAGASVEDISLLMGQAMITMSYFKDNEENDNDQQPLTSPRVEEVVEIETITSPSPSANDHGLSSPGTRLDINYILS